MTTFVDDSLEPRLSFQEGSLEIDFNVNDSGLGNAVLISLFTSRRSDTSEKSGSPGFWGDAFDDVETGSRIPEILSGKVGDNTLTLLENEAKDALDWMIEDGVCSEIVVEVTGDKDRVYFDVKVVRGKETESLRYALNWNTSIDRSADAN